VREDAISVVEGGLDALDSDNIRDTMQSLQLSRDNLTHWKGSTPGFDAAMDGTAVEEM